MTKKQYENLAIGAWHRIEFPFTDGASMTKARLKANRWLDKVGEYPGMRVKTIFINNAFGFEYHKVPRVY